MLDELRELYQEVILDHGKHPRNLRHPADANRHAHGHNPMCGDTVTVYLTVDPQGLIEDVAFEGKGCAISMASASLMTETLKGRSAAEARTLFQKFQHFFTSEEVELSDGDEALERLQVLSGVRAFPMRVKCATLAWHTLNAALEGREETSTE